MLKRYASLLLVGASLLAGCRFFRSEATISIQALTGDGEALPNAKIIVNKIPLGQTDDHGYFKSQLELPVEEPLLVEVSKSSKETFYAPYFETITVKRGDLNSFKLTATLYGVKPETSQVPEAPSPETEAEPLAEVEGAASTTLEVADTALPNPTLATASDAATSASEDSSREEAKGRPVTFYVVSGREAVENASIYYGDSVKKQWTQGCYSNASGRCTVQLPESMENAVVLIRAKGYQTQTRSFTLLDGDKVRFELVRGRSLEVFALNPNQGNMEGVEGIKVFIQDKEVGETDRFGSFVTPITTDSEGESRVSLSAENWLPAKVDFKRDALSGDSIIQHFQSVKPIAPKLAVMEFISYRAGGENPLLNPPSLEALNSALVQAGAQVINGPALRGKFAEQKISLDDLTAATFHQVQKVPEAMNYVLRPSFIEGAEARIILSALDMQGRMVYSASQSVKAKGSTSAVLSELASQVMQNIRHEGSIIEAIGNDFRINMGKNQGLALGDKVAITGNIRLPSGEITAWDKIATAEVIDIVPERARVRLIQTQANAKVEAGNSVVLDSKPLVSKESIFLQVEETETHGPIGLAEIYKGDQWLGYTDAKGTASLPEIDLVKASELQIFSPGFLPTTLSLSPETKSYQLSMNHVATPIQIESQPEGALVKINGRDLGRTPIDTEIPYPGAAVNIEIGGVDGFELLTRTQAVGTRGIVLRGNTQVTLNRDPLQAARSMAAEGKLVDAVQLLEGIPETDKSYLLAQHQLGELFLNNLKDPVKAATAFHRVTSSPKVEDFQDKRFIGTFINEAVSLFQAGENAVASDQNLAISYWRQTEAILKKTEPELRFVPQAQYSQAVHTLNYYRALALHKTWTVTQSGDDQKTAMNYWKDYIQGTALALPQDQHYDWVKRAEGYFQQIQTARKTVTKDTKAPVAM